MDPNWAADHLQVIRTLMERSAVYRRALAPMMLTAGGTGLVAALAGFFLGINSPQAFIAYWLAVSVVPLVACFLLVRRQALKEAEPFWSPPTRRVAQAVLPAWLSGLAFSLLLLVKVGPSNSLVEGVNRALVLGWLPVGWVILYGCAIHAAGFFMPRGIKLFGWLFVVGGCGLFVVGLPGAPQPWFAHGVMGFYFGVLHLAYGVYLSLSEQRTNAA